MMGPGQRLVKRALDVALAGTALAVASPVMAVTAALIPKKLGPGGVFFRQKRPGYQEKPFYVIKFRSMLEAFDAEGRILPEGERLPPFGWTLRKLSIDELPQLWNVLKGEMSLVGPRPLLMEYLEGYSDEHKRRHDVMPGITGWAQVNGRHQATFKQRLDMDVWYVDHQSLLLDLKILWLTVTKVLLSSNVERPDQPVEAVDDLGLHKHVKARTRAPEAEPT